MQRYKAVFLDRDGTISRGNKVLNKERDQYIGKLIGNDNFELSKDMNLRYFNQVSEKHIHMDEVTSLEIEEAFWKKWYQCILEEHGVTQNIVTISHDLYERFPFYKLKELYPETLELLRYLKGNGYKLGVISDSFPSVELSIQAMGVGEYFDACISSSIVGVMKPDPKIYNTALEALDVSAEESIFVDDYDVEADGARLLGFTAFYLDRRQTTRNMATWTIGKLTHVSEYLEEVKHIVGS